MPTFKLYFREDDIGSFTDIDRARLRGKTGLWRNFEDLYDLNSIVELRLAKSKENPADLLIIRVTNTKEDFINKTFEDPTDFQKARANRAQLTRPRNARDTSGENSRSKQIEGVILREGTRIELRLGYDADPNNLEVEFAGRVARLSGGDVIEIVCQGNGIELLQELKGVPEPDDYGFLSNTPNLISALFNRSPEMKSFGTTGSVTPVGELPVLWNFFGGRSATENIFAPSLFDAWSAFEAKSVDYASYGLALGAFGGPPVALAAGALGLAIGAAADVKDIVYTFFKGSMFYVHQQTVWDVLQELTLRHPGTICGVVPFDRRSTIFFGYPDQLYFYRGPSFAEALTSNESRSYGFVRSTRREILNSKLGRSSVGIETADDLRSELTAAGFKQAKQGDFSMDAMRPYRRYHMITSEHDIVENAMVVNSDGVYNSIQVHHPTEDDEINIDGKTWFSSYDVTDDIKGDDDLNREYIKRQVLTFHNAHRNIKSINLPERYAVGSLCNSLANVYKGKITILGRPGIKPHDVVYIYDSYNDIVGPVEVGSVTHTISYHSGWVTEIVPNMIIMPSNTSAAIHVDTMKRLTTSIYMRNQKMFDANFLDSLRDKTASFDVPAITHSVPGKLFNGITDGVSHALTAKAAGAAMRTAKSSVSSGGKFRTALAAKTTFAGKLLTTGEYVALGGLGRAIGVAAPFATNLLIDYALGKWVNWSKFREPIAFLPVTRNGKAWYTALHGLAKNSPMESISKDIEELIEKADFAINTLKLEFTEIFGG